MYSISSGSSSSSSGSSSISSGYSRRTNRKLGNSEVLAYAIQLFINHAVWRARLNNKQGMRLASCSDWVLGDVVERIINLAPHILDDEVFPGNCIPDAVKSKAKKGLKNFGAAGRRTAFQAAAAREANEQLLRKIPRDELRIWTDGASLGNPGPTGAGICVEVEGSVDVELALALGNGTNNAGELWAIGAGLASVSGQGHSGTVHVLTDSQFAIGLLDKGHFSAKFHFIVMAIKRIISESGLTVKYHKVAAHTGIAKNERADRLASKGAEISRDANMPELDLRTVISTEGFCSLSVVI